MSAPPGRSSCASSRNTEASPGTGQSTRKGGPGGERSWASERGCPIRHQQGAHGAGVRLLAGLIGLFNFNLIARVNGQIRHSGQSAGDIHCGVGHVPNQTSVHELPKDIHTSQDAPNRTSVARLLSMTELTELPTMCIYCGKTSDGSDTHARTVDDGKTSAHYRLSVCSKCVQCPDQSCECWQSVTD